MAQSGLEEIIQLSNLISSSAQKLQKTCTENQLNFPSLSDPGFDPTSEAFRANPVAAEACKIIAAAGLQLAAAVMPPPDAMYLTVSGSLKSAALRVALEGNVTEILREAGPKGLPAEDIGTKAGISGKHVGRLLRMLATHHVYREVEPDVFANNRVSGVLDTMKSHEALVKSPKTKNDQTPGFAALIGHHLDETFKSAAYLWEAIKEGGSKEPAEAPTGWSLAFNEKVDFWDWYERPENAHRLKRFGQGMQGVAALQPPETILDAYDWASLPKAATVVDVGGGVGTSSLPLAAKYDHIKLVIQDRQSVVEDGKKLWQEKNAKALSSKQTVFQVHDFFQEQPIKAPEVFLLKQILHDWPDPSPHKILKRLRDAAGPDTTLIIMDSIVPYACQDPKVASGEVISGLVSPVKAPAPLLANYGAVSEMTYSADLVMMFFYNAQERTISDLEALLKIAGWKLVRVAGNNSSAKGFLQPVHAVPC